MEVKGFDIKTVEGATEYLKNEGIDIDNVVEIAFKVFNAKSRLSLIDKRDPVFELLFRDEGSWAAGDSELTDMMRVMVLKYNNLVNYLTDSANKEQG